MTNLARKLFDAAFSGPRTPRSHAYKAGVLSCLVAKEKRVSIAPPRYSAGMPEYDAFFAGVTEGNAIWRQHLEQQEATSRLPALLKEKA